jgi:hypothetical protein
MEVDTVDNRHGGASDSAVNYAKLTAEDILELHPLCVIQHYNIRVATFNGEVAKSLRECIFQLVKRM